MGTFCDLRGQWCLVLLALDSAGLRRRDRPGPGAIGMSECEAMAAVLTGWGANASCRAGHHTSVVDIPDCHVRDCPRVGAHCVLAPGCISHPETRSKGEWRNALSDSASCGVKRPSQGGATCAFYGIPVAALRSCPVSLRVCLPMLAYPLPSPVPYAATSFELCICCFRYVGRVGRTQRVPRIIVKRPEGEQWLVRGCWTRALLWC